MGHGLNFLNCHNDQGVERSGIAYYDDLGDHNVGEQPQAFVYTDLSGDTAWESNFKQSESRLLAFSSVGQRSFRIRTCANSTRMVEAVFSSNVVVTWQIELDAPSKNENDMVGTASNGFQDFTVHKGSAKFIFRNNDGFDCFAIYYAN